MAAATAPPSCETPGALSALGRSLSALASALLEREEVTIVAIGSSSTKGDGASSDAATYPSRLGAALSARFPRPKINVLNLGIGGQEAPDEAARFKKDVLANKPALVIWQVGTNAAWKDFYYLYTSGEFSFRYYPWRYPENTRGASGHRPTAFEAGTGYSHTRTK